MMIPGGWRPAVFLRHLGHGPEHIDVLLAAGRRCPTLQLIRRQSVLWAQWLPTHRRHYLTFSGPVPGKGRVARVWTGRAWILDSPKMLQIILAPRRLRLVRLKARPMLCHRSPIPP